MVAGTQRKPTRIEFLNVLARTRDIYIKCTHEVAGHNGIPGPSGINTYELDIAIANTAGTDRAHTVEQCFCPDGYDGTSCQRCAAGYYMDPVSRECRYCNCSGRSETCLEADGYCTDCRDFAAGRWCEKCADGKLVALKVREYTTSHSVFGKIIIESESQRHNCTNKQYCLILFSKYIGYYGNPDSPVGCQPCLCVGDRPEARITCTYNQSTENHTCNCPEGFTGARCEIVSSL
jgi:hypothetical protein